MYLLNPYESNNFSHAVSCDDIFKTYSKHEEELIEKPVKMTRNATVNGKKVVIRRAKRRPVKKEKKIPGKMDKFPGTVFHMALDLIVMGVIQNKFHFRLPDKKGWIKMKPWDDPAGFKLKKIDPLLANFQYQAPCLFLENAKYDKSCFISMSKKYVDLLREELYKHSTFQTNKVLTVYGLAKLINKTYPNVSQNLIVSILRRGFKYLHQGCYFKADFIFYRRADIKNYNRDYLYVKNIVSSYDQKIKFKRKLRFLDAVRGEKYTGYYYMALTNTEFNNFNMVPIEAKLHLIMEECMLEPGMRPHIIKVKIRKPLFKKLTILREIKYAKSHTEYIWRWNDQRFESVDNSEYSFNRRIKWDPDYL